MVTGDSRNLPMRKLSLLRKYLPGHNWVVPCFSSSLCSVRKNDRLRSTLHFYSSYQGSCSPMSLCEFDKMAEIPHEPLLNIPNQQTEVNVEAQPQGSRSTRAYKIAGITFLVAVLIVGQVVIAYFLISQNSDLKSLQQDSNNLQSQMTKSKSASQSVSLPVNSLPLLMDYTADQGFAAENPAPQQKTKCQQEASSKKNTLPDFSPVCDERGLYERQQCWNEVCWCVSPVTGEMIADTMQPGNALCSEFLSAGFASPKE